MRKKTITQANRQYLQMADKWHQMLLGFTTRINNCTGKTLFLKTSISPNCPLTDEEVQAKVIMAINGFALHRRTELLKASALCRQQINHWYAAGQQYQLTMVHTQNRTGFFIQDNPENKEALVQLIEELNAPRTELPETEKIFAGSLIIA